MDLVTSNLVNAFKDENSFPDDITPSDLFEHFVNYCIVSKEYADDFDVENLAVAGGNDLQLDGIAILVNGVLISSTDEIDDLVQMNKYLTAEFVFIQAKSGKGFDGAEISNMFFGVRDLFTDEPKLPRNERLQVKEKLLRHIYSKSTWFRHGNPKIKIYFVTTGKWQDDTQLVSRIDNELQTIDELNIFESPTFEPVDARRLQGFYNRAKNALSKTISFTSKITIPTMENVREAYLGFLPATEYLQLITDDSGNLLRGLFYENVRDYQGSNPVNQEIESTLKTDSKNAFVLLNNGVTVVSDDLTVTGNSFTLSGFQIVNGCQTSHVLFNNRQSISADVTIPIKLIIAPEDNLKNQVIKATNRQTVVKTEELSALTDFQKHLEQYYNAVPEEHRLHYERRSQQYRSIPGLEKIRIVSIATQIRAFASMFLSRAHQASRYYGTLLKEVENRIFVESHFPIAYYVSAYALFRIEYYLRRKDIDRKYRPFKYHILEVIRMKEVGIQMPAMTTNKFEKYCETLVQVLQDDASCRRAITDACNILDISLNGDYERDNAKDSTLSANFEAQIHSG